MNHAYTDPDLETRDYPARELRADIRKAGLRFVHDRLKSGAVVAHSNPWSQPDLKPLFVALLAAHHNGEASLPDLADLLARVSTQVPVTHALFEMARTRAWGIPVSPGLAEILAAFLRDQVARHGGATLPDREISGIARQTRAQALSLLAAAGLDRHLVLRHFTESRGQPDDPSLAGIVAAAQSAHGWIGYLRTLPPLPAMLRF